MARLAALAAVCLALAPAATVPAAPTLVDAADHDAFWLWAGVRPQPVLTRARRVYLLQGEVLRAARATSAAAGSSRSEDQGVRLESRRAALPHIGRAQVWLVVRAETLAWPPDVYAGVFRELAAWRAAGNDVVGLQVDFDARTRRLGEYAAFLRDLRRRLPADTRLGITGLLDWSANGDPAGLDALAGTVDEAVLQIYQGRRVIPGYAAYLARLGRMKVPFRIGLLQGGEWRPPPALANNPLYAGTVVFLRNE